MSNAQCLTFYNFRTIMAGRPKAGPEVAARGARLRTIREGLGVSQYVMATKLNEAARRLGLPGDYMYFHVSRMERGSVTFEDAAVWLSLTNGARSWDWLVFGEEHHARPAAKPMHAAPKPASASAHKRTTSASGRGR